MLYIIINATIIGPLVVTQVNMFYWMYAWSTMAPIGLHVCTGPIYMYACLRTLHRFNVLLEISVALVPCILAAMPSNNL